MDFANLVQNYLSQKSEGDPSFMISEEALTFVDLMRSDDMDRRASQVPEQTNADVRGEPTLHDLTEEPLTEAVSSPHSPAESTEPFQSPPEDTTPASAVSEVALGAELLQAFQDPGNDAESAGPFSESTATAEPIDKLQTDQDEADPSGVFSQEATPQSEPEVAPEFTQQDQPQEQLNSLISEEGIQSFQSTNAYNETTILYPEDTNFEALLRDYDRDVHPPDPAAGDVFMFTPDDVPNVESPESSSEYAEKMISHMSQQFLELERSRP